MRGVVCVAMVLIAVLFGSTAFATPAEDRAAKREADVVAALAAKNPQAAAWMREAADALKRSDGQLAGERYAKVLDAEPTFTPAMARYGFVLVATGSEKAGLALARKAVELEDTHDNRHWLAFSLAITTEGKRANYEEALTIAHDLARGSPSEVDEQLFCCRIAIEGYSRQAYKELIHCSTDAQYAAPNEPEPYEYALHAAFMRGDRRSMESFLEKGRAAGMNEDKVKHFELELEILEGKKRFPWRAVRPWAERLAMVLGAWLGGFVLLWIVGSVLSDRAMKNEHAPQRTYRAVLQLANAYDVASLPLVLSLSIAGGGGTVAAFARLDGIPTWAIVVNAAVALYTIASIIKTLVLRARDEAPGLGLDLAKHPRLAEVLREVAERVGTRPVDRVYLGSRAELAVFERRRGERCLLLGVGLIEGMSLARFEAVLAHEYGHFLHADTHAGAVALRTRRALLHTADRLVQGGAAAWYNPAWLFMAAFRRMFLRISRGAAQLQEVVADRAAAKAYGAEALSAGLEHVVRRGVEIDAHLDATLKEVLEHKLALANVYAFTPRKRPETAELEAEIARLRDAEPSADDGHAKLSDRVRRLTDEPTREPNVGDAWSIFESREAIEMQVTDDLRAILAARGHVILKPV